MWVAVLPELETALSHGRFRNQHRPITNTNTITHTHTNTNTNTSTNLRRRGDAQHGRRDADAIVLAGIENLGVVETAG